MRCGAILDTFSTAGLFSTWPVNMKFLLCGVIFTLTLIQALLADVCTDSAVPVTVNSGVDATLFYNRSNHESSKHFLGYRAYALSSLFAYITKTESEGRCTEPLHEICSKGRAEFKKWSQSFLMIKIFNVAVSDSGKYKVVALFSGSLYNSKMEKCLQVQHLTASGPNYSGPQPTQDYRTTTMKSSGPQSTQDYSTTTMKSSGPPPTQDYSTTKMKSSGPPPTQDYRTTTMKSSGPQPTQDYSTTKMKSSGPQSTQDFSTTIMKSSGPKVSMAPTSSSNESTWITISVVLGTILGLLLLAFVGIARRTICFRQTLINDCPLLKPKEVVSTAAITMPNPQFSNQVRQDNTLHGGLGVQHCENIELVDQSSGRTPLLTTLQEEQSHQNERCTAAPYKIPRPVNLSLPSDFEEKVAQELLHSELVDQSSGRTPLLTTLQEEQSRQNERCTAAPYKIPRLVNSSVPSDSEEKVAQELLHSELVDQSSGRTSLLTTLQEEQSHQNERCAAAPYKNSRPANPSLASDSKGSNELERLRHNFCSHVDNCSTAPYKTPRNPNSLLPSNFKGESPYTPAQSQTDWEVPCDSLKLLKKIGGGEFGQVWKGEAKDLGHTQGWSEVAVKMLKEKSSPSDLQDLWHELKLLKRLQAEPHPNVIRLLGCLTKDIFRCKGREFRPPLVILEFVPHGDLLGFLRKRREEKDDSPRKVSTQQLYKFACDIARGMAFISAQKLIHRDLAARNILVGEGLRCKITDLGMTRHGGEAQIYVRKSKGVEPLRWMAVESLDREVFTTKSDVWSYGIVLYEIFTLGDYPYSGMKGLEVYKYVSDGHRLERRSRVSQELYDLMLQCWDQAPSRRPTFESIATWMETYTHH